MVVAFAVYGHQALWEPGFTDTPWEELDTDLSQASEIKLIEADFALKIVKSWPTVHTVHITHCNKAKSD